MQIIDKIKVSKCDSYIHEYQHTINVVKNLKEQIFRAKCMKINKTNQIL